MIIISLPTKYWQSLFIVSKKTNASFCFLQKISQKSIITTATTFCKTKLLSYLINCNEFIFSLIQQWANWLASMKPFNSWLVGCLAGPAKEDDVWASPFLACSQPFHFGQLIFGGLLRWVFFFWFFDPTKSEILCRLLIFYGHIIFVVGVLVFFAFFLIFETKYTCTHIVCCVLLFHILQKLLIGYSKIVIGV